MREFNINSEYFLVQVLGSSHWFTKSLYTSDIFIFITQYRWPGVRFAFEKSNVLFVLISIEMMILVHTFQSKRLLTLNMK